MGTDETLDDMKQPVTACTREHSHTARQTRKHTHTLEQTSTVSTDRCCLILALQYPPPSSGEWVTPCIFTAGAAGVTVTAEKKMLTALPAGWTLATAAAQKF